MCNAKTDQDYVAGETALMKASRGSYKQIVDELLRHGAQRDVLNYEHMTARQTTLDIRVDAVLAGATPEESNEAIFAAPVVDGRPLSGV